VAVMVLLIEKGTKLANKIIANNRQAKDVAFRRRIYLMRQSGHTTAWIAWKLGVSEAYVRTMLV